jgi:hypothetical protein
MDARIGLGIAISGTLNPAKVLNFFGVAGTWNPERSATSSGSRPAMPARSLDN